jgi:transcriptional regulator with XRE-family HTH domain
MIGRPPSKPAPEFGQRLAALRKAKGLPQAGLAERMGTTRKTIDYYERRAGNPSLEVVRRVAEALEVSPAELMGLEAPKRAGRPGPAGQLAQVFEEAARLPPRQQEKIAAFVSAYVKQYEQTRQS